MSDLLSSTGALLILGQVALVIVIGFILMALYARKAARRKADLVQRLESMSQLYRSTLIMLTRTLANQGATTSESKEDPEQALADKLAETLAHLKTLGTEETEPTLGTDPAIQAAQIRYQMLLAEQELPAQSNDESIFWQSYTARANKLLEALIPEQQENEAAEPEEATNKSKTETTVVTDEHKAEIEELKRTIDNLKAKLRQKELYREEVLDSWAGKKNQIIQHYDRLLKATRRAENKYELANILTGLFNDCADLGETISDERITHKGVAGIEYDEAAAASTGTVHHLDGSSDSTGKVILKQTSAGRKREALKKKNATANVSKALDKDVKDLKTVVKKQRGLIQKLKDRVEELESNTNPNAMREYEQQVIQLEQLLTENDNNIASLEGELTQATETITHLEDELFIALDALAHYQAGEVDALRQLTEEQLQALEQERERLTAKKANQQNN